MRTFTKFSLRFAAYLLVLLYLVGDLFIFGGPLHNRIKASNPNSPEAIAKAKANGVVARVFYNHITRKQLDYAIYEKLWIEGKKLSDLTPPDRKLVTYAALGDLIDHEIMRVKVAHNTNDLPVSEEEIAERLKRFAGKFQSRDELKSALQSRGISGEKGLRNYLAAQIQQEKYVALRVDKLVIVSEEEIQAYYEENKQYLELPERIQTRQIFVATLDKTSEDAKAPLEKALAELSENKKDFATLAKEISEDAATKEMGGDMGWMSKLRLPADFSEQVFQLALNKPTLVRTKIGWHLIEIMDRKSATSRTLEETRSEIIEALSTVKRHQAVIDFRTALRKFEEHKIDIFHDQLAP